ncbi:hypothetical protein [Psychrobacter sp. KH172YL61]|uniref:hypothetical protein n=1 Tax=Psychrobacter sp. KH172YL61 TaxID=2517899 RepID=UPI001F081DFC|nr:hypothetical protein [Psychrobacter sp. KH172YL61]
MHQHDMRSAFIPTVIATGLLPATLCDLLAQRQRWVYGNMQIFVAILPRHCYVVCIRRMPRVWRQPNTAKLSSAVISARTCRSLVHGSMAQGF